MKSTESFTELKKSHPTSTSGTVRGSHLFRLPTKACTFLKSWEDTSLMSRNHLQWAGRNSNPLLKRQSLQINKIWTRRCGRGRQRWRRFTKISVIYSTWSIVSGISLPAERRRIPSLCPAWAPHGSPESRRRRGIGPALNIAARRTHSARSQHRSKMTLGHVSQPTSTWLCLKTKPNCTLPESLKGSAANEDQDVSTRRQMLIRAKHHPVGKNASFSWFLGPYKMKTKDDNAPSQKGRENPLATSKEEKNDVTFKCGAVIMLAQDSFLHSKDMSWSHVIFPINIKYCLVL